MVYDDHDERGVKRLARSHDLADEPDSEAEAEHEDRGDGRSVLRAVIAEGSDSIPHLLRHLRVLLHRLPDGLIHDRIPEGGHRAERGIGHDENQDGDDEDRWPHALRLAAPEDGAGA